MTSKEEPGPLIRVRRRRHELTLHPENKEKQRKRKRKTNQGIIKILGNSIITPMQ